MAAKRLGIDLAGWRRALLRPTTFPAAVALAVVIGAGVFAERQNARMHEQAQRAEVLAQVSDIRARLEKHVNGNIQLVRGLVSAIALEPNVDQARFGELAASLFREDNQLRSLAVAPDLVVRMVYPIEGNREALGLDYRTHPEQSAAALSVLERGEMVLAGPVDLVQGGRGFVARYPVYGGGGRSADDVWGLVAAVIDVERLYRDSGLLDPGLDIDVALVGHDATGPDGVQFHGPPEILDGDPVRAEVVLPAGTWEIAAIPRGGWAVGPANVWLLRLFVVLGGTLIVVPIVVAGRLVEERQRHIAALHNREVDLQRLSRRLALALETSQVGVWEYDPTSGGLYWDDRMNELYGKPADDGPRGYDDWAGALHPEDRERAVADFAEALRTGGRYLSQYRLQMPDGEVRWIRAIGAMFADDGGEKILGVNWDVTADVAVVEERQRHIAELRDGEERSQALSQRLGVALAASRLGVWELDIANDTLLWDERLYEIYGLRPGEGNAPPEWEAYVHPDDRERADGEFREALAAGAPCASEFRIVRPDGEVRHIRARARVYEDAGGRSKMIGVEWDVTADVELNRALEQAKTLAEARNAELEAAKARIEHNALHDPLTGLPNRRYLDETLEHLAARQAGAGGTVALLHIDLDRFKQINDTLGHAAGDAMLVHASNVLKTNLREGDFVARIGGDEFVVVCTASGGPVHLASLANRIITQMRRPVLYEGHECRFGVSVGIASDGGSHIDPKRLLVNADIALYRAKSRGRNRHEFFTKVLQAEIVETKRVADDILSGLDRNEFVAFYQPQFDAKTLDVAGVEALVRWRHPADGLLPPDAFLRTAEELNVVATIDRMILEQALRDFAVWTAAGLGVPKISVNVSSRRLHDEELVSTLRQLDITPGTVSFELVESIFLDERDDIVQWNIDQLGDLGIDIEIDDFGTGHASIVSLLRLQPRRLKIDRQLVMPVTASPARRRLVESIIDIGRSLGIEVVAEGVETMEHARLLRDLGCHMLQGYAFARPMSADELARFVGAQDWREVS